MGGRPTPAGGPLAYRGERPKPGRGGVCLNNNNTEQGHYPGHTSPRGPHPCLQCNPSGYPGGGRRCKGRQGADLPQRLADRPPRQTAAEFISRQPLHHQQKLAAQIGTAVYLPLTSVLFRLNTEGKPEPLGSEENYKHAASLWVGENDIRDGGGNK